MAGPARACRIAIIVAGLCAAGHARPANAQNPVEPAPRTGGSPGTIAGVVLKLPGGEPAAGASVKVLDEPFGVAPAGAQTQTATAAADGSFRFDNLEPGDYWLVANLAGFMPTEYGQRSATGEGMPVAVAAGQRLTGIRLAMTPTATISGRVFDEDGEPAGRVQVLALRMVYRDGSPSLTIAQTTVTNDRGEYRLFWLPPASYRVAARPFSQTNNYPAAMIGPPKRFGTAEQASPPVVDRRTAESGAIVEETYVPMYATGTANPQSAVVINLAPGENATADVQLAGNRVPAHHVRGVVVNATGQPVPFPLQIDVVPRVPSPMAAIPSAVARADGSFDVAGVPAGSYIVYARNGDGALPIEVADADLDNAVVTLDLNLTIAGRITVEHGAENAQVDLSAFRVQLEREPDLIGMPTGGAAFNPPAAADGTFSIGGVKPGDYVVTLPPILTRSGSFGAGPGGPRVPDVLRNAYIKAIRQGKADVLADGLHTADAGASPLEVVISLSGAHVEGTVFDNARAPAPNVVVAIVPAGDNRTRADLYKKASTDRTGRFEFRGMPPGDYTVYAWDDVERGAWQNPEFLRAFEGRGRFVRLREGANDPLEISTLPIR